MTGKVLFLNFMRNWNIRSSRLLKGRLGDEILHSMGLLEGSGRIGLHFLFRDHFLLGSDLIDCWFVVDSS